MRRHGMNIPGILRLSVVTAVIALLFLFQGIGVSYSSALPETKIRASVLKNQGAVSQYQSKKFLKLFAVPNNTACSDVVFSDFFTVRLRFFSLFPPFQPAFPARAPPVSAMQL